MGCLLIGGASLWACAPAPPTFQDSTPSGGSPQGGAAGAPQGGQGGLAGSSGEAGAEGGQGGNAGEKDTVRLQSIVLGGDSSCAVSNEKNVWCWGANKYGTLALDPKVAGTLIPAPTRSLALEGSTKLTLGPNHGCGIWPDASVRCWGFGGLHWNGGGGGQLGKTPASCTYNQCSEEEGANPNPTKVEGVLADSVAVGYWHSCARKKASGLSACWGTNKAYTFGLGSYDENSHPVPENITLENVSEFALGDLFSCARDYKSEAYCWGYNNLGMLGQGVAGETKVPTKTKFPYPTSSIKANWKNVCALKGDEGTLWCAGKNGEGQLGQGKASEYSAEPLQVSLSNPVLSFSVGHSFACALVSGGGVWCWGDNSSGQVKPSGISLQTSPVQVELPQEATQIAAGNHHACAVLKDESLWCWGRNEEGQLGQGKTSAPSSPTPVQFPSP